MSKPLDQLVQRWRAFLGVVMLQLTLSENSLVRFSTQSQPRRILSMLGRSPSSKHPHVCWLDGVSSAIQPQHIWLRSFSEDIQEPASETSMDSSYEPLLLMRESPHVSHNFLWRCFSTPALTDGARRYDISSFPRR